MNGFKIGIGVGLSYSSPKKELKGFTPSTPYLNIKYKNIWLEPSNGKDAYNEIESNTTWTVE